MKFWDRLDRIEEKWQTMWVKISKLFPPGYHYKSEINSSWVLIGLGLFMTLNFYERLDGAYRAVHVYSPELGRHVYEGAVARPFVELSEGYLWWFLPWLIYQLVNVVLHYTYYYRGTKSIYVMRRIASVRPMVKSCVCGTCLQLAMGAAVIVLGYLCLIGVYFLVMPVECSPRFL